MRHAISFTKGCYVGQEVVERSDAIGRVPRKLERIVVSPGKENGESTEVKNHAGQEVGRVVTSYSDQATGKTIHFVLLRNGKYSPGEEVVVKGDRGRVVSEGELIE
jgi:folate-binding Fe-S cluster repair protein YgfZ